MLNRAPTLHRLGIQAFEPHARGGRGHQDPPAGLHGLQRRLRRRPDGRARPAVARGPAGGPVPACCGTNNILSPANGQPMAAPSQDIVIGCYYLTREKPGRRARGWCSPTARRCASPTTPTRSVCWRGSRCAGRRAHRDHGGTGPVQRDPSRPAPLRQPGDEQAGTDAAGLPVLRHDGQQPDGEALDELKDLGFRYATLAGISIAIDDMLIPARQGGDHRGANKEVVEIEKQYQDGLITDGERYNKIIDIWTHVTDESPTRCSRRSRRKDEGEVQPRLHDGRLRRARQPPADPAVGRHARPDGQAVGGDHRNARSPPTSARG